MAILSDLISRLVGDFPDFRFVRGDKFMFQPPQTIIVGPDEPDSSLLVLHELGHALNGDFSFNTEVERLKIEVAAWEKARELAARYSVEFDEEVMQRELDTYRDFLHQKSRCPKCGLTRFQTVDGVFHCPRCDLIF